MFRCIPTFFWKYGYWQQRTKFSGMAVVMTQSVWRNTDFAAYLHAKTACRSILAPTEHFFLSPRPHCIMSSSFTKFIDHTLRRTAVGRTPLTNDQLVAETSTWQNTTLTTDKLPCPRWDSKPQSQQAKGRSPTPWTADHWDRHRAFSYAKIK